MISDVFHEFLSGNIQRYDLPQELRAYIDEPVYSGVYGEEIRDICRWIASAAHDPNVPLVAITATIGRINSILTHGASNAEP